METVDTALGQPAGAFIRGPSRWGPPWAAAVLAALLAGAGCSKPELTPIWSVDPCNAAAEFEKCGDDFPPQRWRCDPVTSTWVTLAYCPPDTQCAAAPLPAEATAGIASTCVAKASADGATLDGGGADTAQGDTAQGDIAQADSTLGDSTLGDSAQGGDGGPAGDAIAGKDAGKDSAAPPDAAKDALDATGGLCGNGVCDQEESVAACPLDCAKPVCGNGQCQTGESGACAYDCTAGAAAGAACMLAKCPGEAQACKTSSSCPVALAAIWGCAKGCSGCLAKCLSSFGKDPKVFSVASCGAAACL